MWLGLDVAFPHLEKHNPPFCLDAAGHGMDVTEENGLFVCVCVCVSSSLNVLRRRDQSRVVAGFWFPRHKWPTIISFCLAKRRPMCWSFFCPVWVLGLFCKTNCRAVAAASSITKKKVDYHPSTLVSPNVQTTKGTQKPC